MKKSFGLLALLASGNCFGAGFLDTSLSLDDYTSDYFFQSAGFGYGRSNSPTLGNPGDCLTATYSTQQSGTTRVREFLTYKGFEYDPGTQGAISTIDFSIDRRWTKTQGSWNYLGATAVFTVLQGSRMFYTSNTLTYNLGSWLTFGKSAGAVDFQEWDPIAEVTKPGTPDFSAIGTTIRTGLYVGWTWTNNSGSTFGARDDFDNFSVEVNPVPEPGTLTVLGACLAVLGKRRR